jgi:hypothetical protein
MLRLIHHPWLRLAALLGALAAFALLPLTAAGKVPVTLYDGQGDDPEGDPTDSNDISGGGSGSHDDIQSTSSIGLIERPAPGLIAGRWMLLLVPDRSLGVTVFTFVVVERPTAAGEGWDAQ